MGNGRHRPLCPLGQADKEGSIGWGGGKGKASLRQSVCNPCKGKLTGEGLRAPSSDGSLADE